MRYSRVRLALVFSLGTLLLLSPMVSSDSDPILPPEPELLPLWEPSWSPIGLWRTDLAEWPTTAVCGDFDGDGDQDVCVLGSELHVLENLGEGSLIANHANENTDFRTISRRIAAAVADLNQDGRDDLVAAGENTQEIRFYQSQAREDGFDLIQTLRLPSEPRCLLLADTNHDGKADLFVLLKDGQCILAISDTEGTYRLGDRPLASESPHGAGLVVEDLDGDGNLDMAISSSQGVRVYSGDGTGGFIQKGECGTAVGQQLNPGLAWDSEELQFYVVCDGDVWACPLKGDMQLGGLERVSAFAQATAVATTDIDGDGRDDLVVLHGDGYYVTVSYSLGSRVTYAVGFDPFPAEAVTVGDVTGDGIADLILCIRGAHKIQAFYSGEAQRLGRTTFPLGGSTIAGVGDLNQDGLDEILTGWHGQNIQAISWRDGQLERALLRNPAHEGGGLLYSAMPVDWNGDGSVDVAALSLSGYQGFVDVLASLADSTGEQEPALSEDLGVSPTPALAIGDFDGDGAGDLAFARKDRLEIRLGGVNPKSVSVQLGDLVGVITAGDVDADGEDEIAVAVMNGAVEGSTAEITLIHCENREVTTVALGNPRLAVTPLGADIADTNGDGYPEILFASAVFVADKANDDGTNRIGLSELALWIVDPQMNEETWLPLRGWPKHAMPVFYVGLATGVMNHGSPDGVALAFQGEGILVVSDLQREEPPTWIDTTATNLFAAQLDSDPEMELVWSTQGTLPKLVILWEEEAK